MRRIPYRVVPGVGPRHYPCEGTLVDLRFDVPYVLLPGRPLPTYEEVTALRASGAGDRGLSGGCRWEPFTVSPEEDDEAMRASATDSRLHDGTQFQKLLERLGPFDPSCR